MRLAINIKNVKVKWAKSGCAVSMNGNRLQNMGKTGSFVLVKRTWKTVDVVQIDDADVVLHGGGFKDNPKKIAALMYGPLVMAGAAEANAGVGDWYGE